jgi:hypothetical protein
VRSPYASSKYENQRCGAQAGGIVAKLSDCNNCTALGLTARSSSPVIVLCRTLIAAGHDPALPMHVFRGGTLALVVRSIGEAARLEVSGNGSGFIARCDRRASPPIAPNAPARTGHRARRAA